MTKLKLSGRENSVHTDNIPSGTFQITLSGAIQYLIMGSFYIIITKTNSLTQKEIGILSILQFLSSTVILVTGLALPTALVKFTSEHVGKDQLEEAGSIQKTVTRTVLMLSFIGCLLGVFLSSQLSQYLFGSSSYAHLIILTLIYTLLFSVTTVYSSALQALFLFGKTAVVALVFIITSRATAVGLALFHMGLDGVLMGYVIGSLAALGTVIYFIRSRLPETNHSTSLKPILKFSLPLFLSSLTLLILNWADVIIVSIMTSDYSLTGVYYIAINSVTVLSILWLPVTATILPALSARNSLNKSDDIGNILKISSRYMIYIILPSCLGLAAISSTALAFFYGSNYVLGAISLSILSVNSIIIAVYSLFATALTALGKTTQILEINVISAVLTIIILIAIVPLFQIVGAAVTRLIAQAIGAALVFYLLRKEIRIQIDKEALLKSTGAASATIPILLILETTISRNLSIVQTLLLEIVTAVAIYALSLYLLKALKTQDFELLRQALPKALTKFINFAEKIAAR